MQEGKQEVIKFSLLKMVENLPSVSTTHKLKHNELSVNVQYMYIINVHGQQNS